MTVSRRRQSWRELAWRVGDRIRSGRRALLGCWRVAKVVAFAIRGWVTVTVLFPRLQQSERDLHVRQWARRTLRAMGVSIEASGEPPAHGPALLVANHLSWLDILVLLSQRHCRFVAKSEVRHWPVIGTMATAAGTLYIERESRRDALRVVHRMAAALQDGQVVAIFPEGTTSSFHDGVLPFHGNLVQAALVVDAPAVPVGLVYCESLSGRPSSRPEYVGDDTLAASLWRTVSGREDYTAWIGFGPPQHAGDRDRRRWAADLRQAVLDVRA